MLISDYVIYKLGREKVTVANFEDMGISIIVEQCKTPLTHKSSSAIVALAHSHHTATFIATVRLAHRLFHLIRQLETGFAWSSAGHTKNELSGERNVRYGIPESSKDLDEK